jgi:hypothetical protein
MDRDRLIKLLGMTGSTHVGEAANAAWMAGKLLKEANLTWNDVICPPAAPKYTERTWEKAANAQTRRRTKEKPRETNSMRAAKIIMASDAPITEWERKFLGTMMRATHPTQKQMKALLDISRKYGFL